jgi:hypothetical protein
MATRPSYHHHTGGRHRTRKGLRVGGKHDMSTPTNLDEFDETDVLGTAPVAVDGPDIPEEPPPAPETPDPVIRPEGEMPNG